ncbi:MAG: N,N-dimethylformamidase beta subunit family domain-containing protein, partial [Terriglobales bacterium]
MLFWITLVVVAFPACLRASCGSPANAIEAENCLPGTPQTTWDISTGDAGDPSIQGFADQISVKPGDTINFKINTNAAAYTIDIYRMGYYQGNGARLITSVTPSASLPQAQPACYTDSSTNLVDCGNWAVSASWQVPNTAVSGIYFAQLVRDDTVGTSHI